MKFFLPLVLMISYIGKINSKGIFMDRKEENKTSVSYFSSSKKEVSQLLTHKVFSKYQDYIIETIRQGEIKESQAYFVRLVKPFESPDEGICLAFLGTSEIVGKPRKCKSLD